MLLPRKLILLALFIHFVTIFACASLQPEEEKVQQQQEQIEAPEEVNQAEQKELIKE